MAIPDDSNIKAGLIALWLEIATGQFSPLAKERIRSEIEAHYAEAIKAHLSEGLSDSDAADAALAEMGDPKVAARKFRRRYLTEREVDRFEWSMKNLVGCYGPLFLPYLLFFFCQFILYYFHAHDHSRLNRFFLLVLVSLVEFLLLVVWPTFAVILARRNRAAMSTLNKFILLLRVNCVSDAAVMCVLVIQTLFSSNGEAFVFRLGIMSLSLYLLMIIHAFFRANKFSKADEIWGNSTSKPVASS